jgi:hypothetical protein
MKGKYPLNRTRLHRALLDLLQHPEVKLEFATVKGDGAGYCEWDDVMPPTNIRIVVDANTGDDLRFVLHELLHVILFPLFVGRTDSTLEEVAIMAYDTYMWEYISKDAEREKRWRTVMRKKAQAGQKPIPLAAQADRTKDDAKERAK